MTPQALIMMAISWSVILYFAVRFFIKVIKTPQKEL